MQIEDAQSICKFLLQLVTVLTDFTENPNHSWEAEVISKENEQVVFLIVAVF